MNASCRSLRVPCARLLGVAIVFGLLPVMASAQDHSHMHMPMGTEMAP